VTGLTSNLNMIPTIVLLGSFLVPATAVIWYLDHYHSAVVTPAVAARAFIANSPTLATSGHPRKRSAHAIIVRITPH